MHLSTEAFVALVQVVAAFEADWHKLILVAKGRKRIAIPRGGPLMR